MLCCLNHHTISGDGQWLVVFIQWYNFTGSDLYQDPAIGILGGDRVLVQAVTQIKPPVAVGFYRNVLTDIQRHRR